MKITLREILREAVIIICGALLAAAVLSQFPALMAWLKSLIVLH